MEEINLKLIDDKISIKVSPYISNNKFFDLIKNKLERIFITRKEINHNIILDLNNRILDSRDILKMFDLFNELEIFYLSKVICKKSINEELVKYIGNIRSGQVRGFNSSLLFIGNLSKGGKVIVNGNMYALGKLRGVIEFKDENSVLYCECLEGGSIKYLDCYKDFYECSSSMIYFDKGEIKKRSYSKEEIYSGKSNSSDFR